MNTRTNTLLLALALAFAAAGRAESRCAPIPFWEIGGKATADYQGDALGITATPEGARLRCDFQKLDGHATSQGLWLESTAPGGSGRFRLTAAALCRESSGAREVALLEPTGPQPAVPTTVGGYAAFRATGKVDIADKLVRFTRPEVIEEYSVSVDGVRQDFLILQRPAGEGDLTVELALRGARAEVAAYGAKLILEGSGRALAYSRLRATDATGQQLAARLEVLSADRLAVTVADANATYPVRIDPTFSDANWVSLNPAVSGADGGVYAMALDSGGNVYVGGYFTVMGNIVATNMAKWTGSAWSALGSGINGAVYALAVSGTNLFAGGSFTAAGGVAANCIAAWNGNAWSALGGSGMSQGMFYGLYGTVVNALAVSGGTLYAGGSFTRAGGVSGVAANSIAAWNGSAWSPLGAGMPSGGMVSALAVSGTTLYAAGKFETAGDVTVNHIAAWNGSAWSALGAGMDGLAYPPWLVTGFYPYVNALAVSGTNLYAGGYFTKAGGVTANYIAAWNGSAWSALGAGMGGSYPYVYALAASGTTLYAGGNFTNAAGTAANHIAAWDGSTWSALGSGVGGVTTATSRPAVWALASDGAGHVFVGGAFSWAGTNVSSSIAQANIPVASLPVIRTQPVSVTTKAGPEALLTVTASGTAPLSYQWWFNGALLTGATNYYLLLSNVQPGNAGSYTVVVTNMYGAVTSAPANLTIESCDRPPVGLINWWQCEGNAVDSVGTNNGALQGGVTSVPGMVGDALHFDGSSGQVVISNAPNLQRLSVETWVRFDSLDSASTSWPGMQYLVFRQNSREYQFEAFTLSKVRYSGGDRLCFVMTSVQPSVVVDTLSSTNFVTTGVFYHVVGTFDGSRMNLYVNGVLHASASHPYLVDYGHLPMFLGNSGTNVWYGYLKGSLDEVSLYDRALSAAEVAVLYAADSSGKCPLEAAVLGNGGSVGGLADSQGGASFFQVFVPVGATSLAISGWGGTGMCSIYARFGAFPTLSSYDYRTTDIQSGKTVLVANPSAGTWYIMLYGNVAYANVSLMASYGSSPTITPALTASKSNNVLVVRWPSNAAAFVLESTTNLSATGSWRAWGFSGDDGTWRTAVVSTNLPRQFFRLQ